MYMCRTLRKQNENFTEKYVLRKCLLYLANFLCVCFEVWNWNLLYPWLNRHKANAVKLAWIGMELMMMKKLYDTTYLEERFIQGHNRSTTDLNSLDNKVKIIVDQWWLRSPVFSRMNKSEILSINCQTSVLKSFTGQKWVTVLQALWKTYHLCSLIVTN